MTSAACLAVLLLSTAPEATVPERAAAAYQDERWAEAAELFAEAYEQEPDPKYIYAAAQASRLAGDCASAVPQYRTFLEVNDLPAAEADARDNLEQCEAELADRKGDATAPAESSDAEVPPPVLPPDPGPAPEQVEQPPEKTPARRWYADPLGGALLATGVVSLAVGGGLYGQARTDERTANESEREPIYEQRINRAATLSRAAIGLFAVGGAAVLAASIRYALVGTRHRRRKVALGPRGLRF